MPLLCGQPLNSVSSVQPYTRKSQQLSPGHNLCPLPSHSAPLVLAATAAAAVLRQAGGSCVGWKPARTQHDTPRAASSQQQQQQQQGSEREWREQVRLGGKGGSRDKRRRHTSATTSQTKEQGKSRRDERMKGAAQENAPPPQEERERERRAVSPSRGARRRSVKAEEA